MAIDLEDEYPGRVAAASAAWPFGEPQNRTSPGDGTPWEVKIAKDLIGSLHAVLNEAGSTPSGTPETATTSQFLQALQSLFPQVETGTFTPELGFVTATYNSQVGKYIKHGNLVYFSWFVDVASLDTADASLIHIDGLPHTVLPDDIFQARFDYFRSTLFNLGVNDSINPRTHTGPTGHFFASRCDGTDVRYNSGLLNTSGILRISGVYRVA